MICGGSWRRALACLLGIAVPALGGVSGCVAIDGGAVEVAWALFAQDGRAINDCSCADPEIASVRLELVPIPDDGRRPCDVATCRFACGRKVGATPFMIPPGDYLISLVPAGPDGGDLAVPFVEVPPPVSRTLVKGQPTELEALEIKAAACAARCNGGGATQPCTGA